MAPDLESWTWELRDPGDEPDVSIIICAHGHWPTTWACLAALNGTQRANRARAEVILVDDCSPDDTLAQARQVRGLRVVALESNVGFLMAANAGLGQARGRHVLFLNNDTEPVGAWLDPLLDTLQRRPGALCVGSRLVYPDGALQEAGGIIFDDASGWNYGRGMDAFDPRVTFEREVDYVSGASLLVRGDFLRARGGFDVRYAPAYYEDTDLCFAAREAGGEVWYQPASIVVHHEGQSHGTDESSGIKAYQAPNRVTFARRWAAALQRQWPADAAVVPMARQRALRRKRILVIDNAVPAPDEDSGSVRLASILQMMLDDGYAVTFVPVNGWRREPYTSRLERRGIEVVGGIDEWWNRLEEMRDSISHVWISRPDVAQSVLDRVRESFPEAVVLYDTVDLHFLRLAREAEATGEPALSVQAQQQKLQELSLMQRSDVTIVVSEREHEALAELSVGEVRVVSNAHEDRAEQASPAGRSGVIFVGGFQHRPNEDAVVWFVRSVMPLLHQHDPSLVLTVVGSNVTPAVEALASDTVRVLGWVADIDPLYAMSRVAVAPLRFGAGVKGKVGEAMSLGVPMSVTSVAAEGMHIRNGVHAFVADDPRLMAEQISTLLTDDRTWLRLSAAGRALIRERFGTEATRRSLLAALRVSPASVLSAADVVG